MIELRERLPSLPAAQAGVVRILLANPAAASELAITELAKRADTSPATVTRLCAVLGVPSYPQLRLRLAAAAETESQRGSPQERIAGDVDRRDSLAEAILKVAGAEARTVHDTAERLPIPAVRSVVNRMAKARMVQIFGMGGSGDVGGYLAGKLRSLGVAAVAFDDPHSALTSVAQADRTEVVIGISHSGRTRATCQVLAEASRRRAMTVAITADIHAPLAVSADQVLPVVSSESTFRTDALRSRIADLLIVECLCVALTLRIYEDASVALGRSRQALDAAD